MANTGDGVCLQNEDNCHINKEPRFNTQFTIFPLNDKTTEWLQCSEGDFSVFPTEVILEIFKYLLLEDLKTCSVVSKRWRVLSFNSSLWRKISLHETSIEISSLERVLNCGVKALHLNESTVMTNQVSSDCPFFRTVKFDSLQSLHICETTIKADVLEELLSLVPHVRIIKLVISRDILRSSVLKKILNLKFLKELHCYYSGVADIDNALTVLKTSEVITLTSLTIGLRSPSIWLSGLYEDFLISLLKLCPNLQDLIIMGSFTVSDIILKYIFEMQDLRKLSLKKCQIRSHSDSEILSPVKNYESLANLQEISFHSTYIEEEALLLLLELSPFLKYLELNNFEVTYSIIEKIMNLEYLKHLRLIVFDPKVRFPMLNYLECCTFLKELYCARLESSRPKNPQMLNSLLRSLTQCNCLELINFDLDDGIFRKIFEMKYLKYLNLGAINKNLLVRIFSNLDHFEKLVDLAELKITYKEYCKLPLDIEILLPLCPNLSSLHLGNCVITDKIWKYIASMELHNLYLNEIEEISLSEIFNNNDISLKLQHLCITYINFERNPSGLAALLSLCVKTLESLSLNNLFLTDNIYEHIFTSKELTSLTLSNVLGISTSKVSDIVQECPKLDNNIKIWNN